MKTLALFAIRAYQRYISPHKGFCCAYRAHTGYGSCSVLGYRAIRRYGVLPGIAVLQKRFKRCTTVHQQHLQHQQHLALCNKAAAPTRHPRLHRQSGFCDVPCDCPSVDLPSDMARDFCDIFDGCNSCDGCQSCDWPSSRKKSEEAAPYIPPRRGSNTNSLF